MISWSMTSRLTIWSSARLLTTAAAQPAKLVYLQAHKFIRSGCGRRRAGGILPSRAPLRVPLLFYSRSRVGKLVSHSRCLSGKF